MMKSYPTIIDEKFQMDEMQDSFAENWRNKLYGGSVFESVSSQEFNNGVKTIHKLPNNLFEDLEKANENKQSNKNYFKLENLYIYERDDYAYFADVWLYQTDSHISAFDRNALEFAQNGTEDISFAERLEKYRAKPSSRPTDFQKFEQVSQQMNGFARMIFYQVHAYDSDNASFNPYLNPRKNRIIQMKEGEVKAGSPEGYNRIMDFMNDVAVGFFKDGKAYGKVQYYENGRLAEQGIYNEISPKNGNTQVKGELIQSFTTNVDPMHI
uniref:Uncharacterized protein n=1 Tax=Strombidium rassoulzadegani TaxID=1082188 RepID=A0A7S3CI48_9SPIT|mmetsp:Transcript_11334/g.19094  ORF Transcript_11334/g.19094 Transcript_11334/m.19094 type:complete len:268 (+) Transcript_11334:571-1374(+)